MVLGDHEHFKLRLPPTIKHRALAHLQRGTAPTDDPAHTGSQTGGASLSSAVAIEGENLEMQAQPKEGGISVQLEVPGPSASAAEMSQQTCPPAQEPAWGGCEPRDRAHASSGNQAKDTAQWELYKQTKNSYSLMNMILKR